MTSGPITRREGPAALRLRKELLVHLVRGPRSVTIGTRRVTTVFDSIRYIVDADRRQASIEVFDPLAGWQPSDIAWTLEGPLSTWHWVDQFLWSHPHLTQDGDGKPLEGHVREWIRYARKVVGIIGRMPDFRQEVRAAIGLDPRLVALANEISPPMGEHRRPDSRDYTSAWRNEEAWRRLARENAELVILLRALERDEALSVDGEFKGLKERLFEQGIGGAGWRFVCRYGRTAFEPAILTAPRRRLADHVAFHASALRMWKGLPLRKDLVASLSASVSLLCEAERVQLPMELIDLGQRACIAAAQKQSAATFLETEWLPVLAWFIETKPKFKREQWALGWEHVLRLKDACLVRKSAKGSRSEWESHVGIFCFGACEIVPLLSRAQLLVEGIEMAHCVADYGRGCAEGIYRVFSIRERETGKRKATIAVGHDESGWQLVQVRGRANTEVCAEVRRVADEVVRACQVSIGPPPMPSEDLLALLESLEE